VTQVFDGLADVFTGTFGETVVWRVLPGDPGINLSGIVIVRPVEQGWVDDGMTVESQTMTVDVSTSAAASIDQGHELDVRSITSIVTRVEPDGRGMTRLSLQRKSV
jgi:hypothetical protein